LREEAIDPEDRVVTQLIPLEYANPDELKKLFAPLISKNSVIISYPPTGILIVTDVLSNIKRLLRIVKAIDVVGIGQEISVVPVEHATAAVLVKSLTTVFGNKVRKKGSAAAPGVKIVADERTNSLIIAATEHDTLRVRELLQLLDKEIPRGEGDIHVYYLQNGNAEDMAKVLTALPSKETRAGKKGKAPVISKEVQIVADKATNSLVITANKDDYLILEDVIKKLDIVRRMVYIEALLMEVSVSKDFDVGVQWLAADDVASTSGRTIGRFGGSTPSQSIMPTLSTTTGQVSLPTGLSVGVLGEAITIAGIDFPNIGAVVQAFQSDSDVWILSNPQIMTTDNEEAEIVVADNIPFLTRQETSTAGVDYSNYEFKDVGVTLNITPQINQERFVRLQISQEVSQVVEQDQIGLPTTLKRQAKTTVVIKDSHTVVFGGLISETANEGTYQVPCLGSVPLFGWLFKTRSRSSDQKNLYIFLTPHIVENPQEAKTIYEEKRGKIDSIREGTVKMYKRPGMRDQKGKVKGEEKD
jgi:general secretion pathway protein D